MKPKEKARELIDKMFLKIPSVYDPTNLPHYPIAKEMALIAVDEIIKALRKDLPIFELGKGFWQEVKHEIEKL